MPLMFERSITHDLLYNLLSKTPEGETVTYARMTAECGHTVDSKTGALRSVLNRLVRKEGIVFGNEPKVGYRRLTAEETVEESKENRGKLHRHAHRNAVRLITVDASFSELDSAHRLIYAAGLSLFQAITAATSHHAMRRLEASVIKTDLRPLPFADTLAAFQSAKKD